jgi:hypothetical protein
MGFGGASGSLPMATNPAAPMTTSRHHVVTALDFTRDPEPQLEDI